MKTVSIDENRTLIRSASPDKIAAPWKKVIEEIIKTCKVHLDQYLISVYVGGSVALGTAIENKSDVDTYAVVDLSPEEIEKAYTEWVDKERKRMDSLFPFQRGVEIHLISRDKMSEGKKFQLKVLAACVYGKDFSTDFPEYKLDKETLGRIRVDASRDIETVKKELQETEDPEEIEKIGTWIAKRMIRCAGMLVLWKGDFYTMDISILADKVIENYPDKKSEIKTLLEYTESAPADKNSIFAVLDSFGTWLIIEDERVFG